MNPKEMEESLLSMASTVTPTTYDINIGKENNKYTIN